MTESVNKVRIAEVSLTSEITYKTFIAAPSSTTALDQESADTRPPVKVDGVSDLCPSPHPINIGIPVITAPNIHNHQHDDHVQKSIGVEKTIDGKPDTERREDVDDVGRSFSEADAAAADDCASLYSFL